MGKAAREKRDRDGSSRDLKANDRDVSAYFARTEMKQPSNGDQLWNGIEVRLGAQFKKDLIAAMSEREKAISAGGVPDNSVYSLLYRDLDTAMATTPLTTPMARVWLTHFAGLDLPDGPLLDVGSGSGFLTCFYASQRPDDQVVGVEVTAEGVACATELAHNLGIENVRFEHARFEDFEASGSFSVVTSVASLRDFEPSVPSPEDPFSWILSGARFLESAESSLVKLVDAQLDAEGAFVSMDRLATFGDLAWWMGAQLGVGLGIDLAESFHLRFSMPPYGSQSMPAMVSRRGSGSQVDVGALARWYDRQEVKGTEILLELMIAVAAGIEVAAGHHFEVKDPRGSGQTRLYILRGDDRSIIYMTTSRGARELVAEGPDVESLREIYGDLVSRFGAMPDVVDSHELDPVEHADDIARFG